MSNIEILKDYLIGREDSFLFNSINNGKVIMLSGLWGSGKTYFWKNEIESTLKNKLDENNRAYVYMSMYGKDNLKEIKEEIFLKASYEKKFLVEEIEVFGFDTLSSMLDNGSKITDTLKAIRDLNKYRKRNKGQNKLKDGGLICFDDFERLSNNISLNDLFGFISQLVLTLGCKVVIILNSNVFKGKNSYVFREIKEKTINKFLLFQPTDRELFDLVFKSKEEYENELNLYRECIYKSIHETKELNGRFYVQVLDNCLEWVQNDDTIKDENTLRALTLVTVNFVKNHFVFDYTILEKQDGVKLYKVLEKFHKENALFEISNYFVKVVPNYAYSIEGNEFDAYLKGERTILPIGQQGCGCDEFLHLMHTSITKKREDSNGKTKSDSYYQNLEKVFHENKDIFYALYYYAYVLQVEHGIDKNIFDRINSFVKNGILIDNC